MQSVSQLISAYIQTRFLPFVSNTVRPWFLSPALPRLAPQFSSCSEGTFDVVVIYHSDMAIQSFKFNTDTLQQCQRNLQIEWWPTEDPDSPGRHCRTTFNVTALVETLQSLMMRRILLGGKRVEREGRGGRAETKESKGDDGGEGGDGDRDEGKKGGEGGNADEKAKG